MHSNNLLTRTFLLFFFFLTGVTGLVYELLWTRMLILVFGSTQFAITTVLTTFMIGLALGSLIFGRISDKYPYPLLLFGIIECAIGIYCFLTLPVFDSIKDIYLYLYKGVDLQYSSFSAAQFLLSSLGIIIPATLMGGTLPVLVKYFANSDKRVGHDVGILYSVNTLGAVLGCFVTGVFFIYFFGIKASLYAAGAMDIMVGVTVLFIGRREFTLFLQRKRLSIEQKKVEPVTKEINYLDVVVLISFTLSGFTALAYEILWFRLFSLIVGSSVYAFTIMLSTFLAGIAIGSAIFSKFIDKRKDLILWFGLLETVIGLSVLLSILLYREFPSMFLSLYHSFSDRFWLFLFLQALLCSTIMLLPTLCYGATFPTVGKIYTKTLSRIGSSIGNIYFFNTLGTIFGSFVGGFILIPFVGLQKSILFVTIINVSIGALLILFSQTKNIVKTGIVALVGISFLILTQVLPPWEKMIMTLGPYANPVAKDNLKALKEKKHSTKLLYYKEGINAVITVRSEKNGEIISYQANGKNEARAIGLRPGEVWSALGHIPTLLHEKPENALLIGLGSGITLGSMIKHPLKTIDVVELEPAVIEAANFFSHVTNNALQDKRVTLNITDGRNYLQTTTKKYDIIISAVSDPWITGVSNLFTIEYFKMLDDRLNKDGIVALWLQNYRITLEDLKTSIKTFTNVFPYGSLWFHYAGASDLILIGLRDKHSFSLELLKKKFSNQAIKVDLKRIDIENVYDFFELFLIGGTDLNSFVGEAPINTDNKPILEFSLPKQLYSDLSTSIDRTLNILENVNDVMPPVLLPENDNAKKEFLINLGKTYAKATYRTDQTKKIFKEVLKLDPSNEIAKKYFDSLH